MKFEHFFPVWGFCNVSQTIDLIGVRIKNGTYLITLEMKNDCYPFFILLQYEAFLSPMAIIARLINHQMDKNSDCVCACLSLVFFLREAD